MSTFFEWFDALTAEAAQTDDGKPFMAEGFVLHHTEADAPRDAALQTPCRLSQSRRLD